MSRQPREKRASPPAWIEPQLSKLVEKAPTGLQWVHEIFCTSLRTSRPCILSIATA